MNEICFQSLTIAPERIDVQAKTDDATYDLYFEFDRDMAVSTTSIALAMSTLCGRAFSKVRFEFPVASQVRPSIEDLTHSEVVASSDTRAATGKRKGTTLSFSGGFDSMAAKLLMPEDTSLVSMDFGGRFAREREFFQKFDTLRVTTNIADTPLRSNSWSFMGIGAILVSDYYRARYHTFGGILEAGPDNMRAHPVAARAGTFPPFRAAGYVNAPFVLGLTEIGTLSVMLRQAPAVVAESLVSVASPGEEKLYRKAVVAKLVADALGLELEHIDIPAPKIPHYEFGKNLAVDLLALYVISSTGEENARGLVRNIPDAALQLASRLDMNFMQRANPTLYENFPKELAPELHKKLAENEVRWYSEKDWQEFGLVRDYLKSFHPIVST